MREGSMIRVEQLTFSYKKGTAVFEDFSWEAQRGETWAVIGPSGCGKTTLLYLVAGILKPAKGTVIIDNELISRPRPRTGLILQDHGLLPWYTVEENAALGLRIRRLYGPDGRHAPPDAPMDESEMKKSIAASMDRLGIRHLKDKYPSQLSGGQRQRTAILRTLIMNPDLLLMDEPFSDLDAPTREDLEDLVMDLQQETGITLVVVTHNIEEALVMGSKVLILEGNLNRIPVCIENPHAVSKTRRDTRDFTRACAEVRSRLGKVS
jgi:ABC-type nitrate/sulfonate/bicarbonate transport system ATPase subunit